MEGAIVAEQISVLRVVADPLVQCVDVARWTYIKNKIVKSFLLIDEHGTHWYKRLPYS